MVALLPPTEQSRLATLTTLELWSELRRGIEVTVKNLEAMSAIWQELERRGEDMGQLRGGMPAYFPLIASGAVPAETVVRLHGIPHLLKCVSLLPASEQASLWTTGAAALAVFQNGDWTKKLIPLAEITESQAKLIFDRRQRRIRPVTEQARILQAPPPPTLPSKPRKRIVAGRVVADATTGTVRIGRAAAPSIDVIRAMKEAGMIR